ncbi:MAG: hypothetical protein IT467_10925 [Dokdonella sp.]|uniref:hypothetical protein n=1 Tax=Dokdonella sp. TaxID=2291710 RepID=UPI0025C2373B|nr:hypothetical protein [Dokdonella sp.]MBZ0222996.1 hypothetical protein [Dokdonella sp.]MCC7256427.1 hypothetical protein [Dokdonella sp.]
MRVLSNPIVCAALIALALASPLASHAGVEPVAASGAQGHARGLGEIDSIDAQAIAGKKNKARTLRCWQKGKLIIEREVEQLPVAEEKAVSVTAAGGQSMRLYDLDNSTCLID